MKISNYLEAKFICSELQATTKEEAIKELAGLIKNCPEISDFDQFLKDVFEREGMMSTGIGNNVAVPHARTDAVNKLVIVMGRSCTGIDFEAIDKQPANLIFLMGTPTKDMGDYLKTLAYLTRVLMKDDFRRQLLDAKSPDEIIRIFAKRENLNSVNH
jgi:PTS system nitrogen regulatory IIA component